MHCVPYPYCPPHCLNLARLWRFCVLVSTDSPLGPECQHCFIPDVFLSAVQVPFVLDGSDPSITVGLRFDVVHDWSEMRKVVLWEQPSLNLDVKPKEMHIISYDQLLTLKSRQSLVCAGMFLNWLGSVCYFIGVSAPWMLPDVESFFIY